MLKAQEDDLFRESAMTFGEHLEELRTRLFRALLWLTCGVIVGFFIGKYVVQLIQSPMEQALGKYLEDRAKEEIETKYGNLSPAQKELLAEGNLADLVFVEPVQLMAPLRDADPELFAKLPAPSRYNISADDLTDARELARRLVEAGKEESKGPAGQLWRMMNKEGREAARAIAANDSSDIDPARRRALAQSLSSAIGDRALVDAGAFERPLADDTELKEIWEQAAKDNPKEPLKDLSVDQLRRFNWLALHTAFRAQLDGPHPTLAPLTVWHKSADDPRKRTKALNPTEGFMIYMKAAVLSGFILSSYFVFREIWMFVAAGLYPHERRYVYVFLPFSVGLFIAGALLAFFVAFPPVLNFLFSFNRYLNIEPDTRISEWLSFALFLPFAFGIGFQLPLVMLFIYRIGIVSLDAYVKQWRVAVLAIFVLSMVLCPSPDPYSMLLMAVPLTLLYFGGIALCHYSSGRKPAGIGE